MSGVAAAVLCSFLASQAPGLSTPLEIPALRERYLAGDLVSVERARVLLGEDVGPLGLLVDLARLELCLPLGPIPARESQPYHAARLLVRFERVRLERRLREGVYSGTPLDRLLSPPPPHRTFPADQSAELVRWPVEEELWPDEQPDPVVATGACGVVPDTDAAGADAATLSSARSNAERAQLALLVPQLAVLPDEAAARVALAFLATGDLRPEWDAFIEANVRRAGAPLRPAALLLMARLKETHGDTAAAVRGYEALLADGGRTDAQDSRARVRLAALAEPDWPRALEITRGARAARAEDWAALRHGEARAIYAMEDWPALRSFGRKWLRERQARPGGTAREGELVAATEELLVRLSLRLGAAEAMAWAAELGPLLEVENRLDRLGQLAVQAGQLELATAVYDRLRIEAAAARAKKGPVAAAAVARWTASRAIVEYARRDAPAFAGLIADLRLQARDDEARPLARTAPHRELARVCQELLGRLTNDVPAEPERRPFAGALLEAIGELGGAKTRWTATLDRYRAPLLLLAGEYAVGREGPPAAPKTRPIRSLGEVDIPRLPPALEAPDHPTPVPAIDTFLIYEEPGGAWRHGAPWLDPRRSPPSQKK